MQSEKMQVQLCPQLVTIQTQLKTAIANHQMMFGSYQKDPENAVLRDKLEEMQVQIKNLSNHQKVLVQQLRGQLMHTSAAVSTVTTPSSGGGASMVVTPTSVAAVTRPLGPLSPRPHLVALPPHASVGIVVPFAHLQAQPTLMTLPGILKQPMVAPASHGTQPLVSVQINSSAAAGTAILTSPTPTPTPLTAVPLSALSSPKLSHSSVTIHPSTVLQSTAAALKLNHPNILQSIQPRRPSPPIKVPRYTANNQGGAIKTEKSNGILQRSFSDSDAKDLKRTIDNSLKDARRVVDTKTLSPAEKKKQEFMACIGLVTPETLKEVFTNAKMIMFMPDEELQNRRVERKRRSTANPHYSYSFDSEKRRNNNNIIGNTSLNSDWLIGVSGSKRPRGRPPKACPSPGNSRPGTPDSQGLGALKDSSLCQKREGCAECGKEGELLACGACALLYHLDCLSPPLATPPDSPWTCPACIVSGKGIGTLSNGALTMVNSYIATKANKEDERRRLQRKNADILHEKQRLQEKARHLKQQIEDKRLKHEKLTESTKEKSAVVDTLTSFVKSFKDPVPVTASST